MMFERRKFWQAHTVMREREYYHLENMCNLDQIPVSFGFKVLVNCVAPGMMEGTRASANLTPEFAEFDRQSTLLRRSADKDDVADAIVTLVRSNSITGQTLLVDSGKVFH